MNDTQGGFLTIADTDKPSMEQLAFYRVNHAGSARQPLRFRVAWLIARFAHWLGGF